MNGNNTLEVSLRFLEYIELVWQQLSVWTSLKEYLYLVRVQPLHVFSVMSAKGFELIGMHG